VTLAFIALLVMAPAPQSSSMLAQIGVPDDPTNGYIDYLKAGDIAQSPLGQRYNAALLNQQWAQGVLNWREPPRDEVERGETKGQTPRPSEEDIKAAQRWIKMTPLEIKREAREALKEMFRLIESARNKKVWDPRPSITIDTVFPEFSAFRRLAQFSNQVVVDTEFALGNGAAATQAILDGFRIGDAGERSQTLIGSLIARAVQAISLRSISLNLDRFSIADCRLIDSYVAEKLAREDTAVAAIASERKAMLKVIDDMFEHQEEGFFPPDLRAKINAVPVGQRPGIISLTKELYEERADKMESIFSGDERKWASYLDTKNEPEQEVTSQEALPHQVAALLTPVLDQMLNAVLLRRLQLRLVRPIMAVLVYRWEHDSLPEKLSDAAELRVVTDPITGSPYQYRKRKPQFEVLGLGTRAMGEIRILQQMAAGSSAPPPP